MIFLTGATGGLGTVLHRHLLGLGEVVSLSRNPSGTGWSCDLCLEDPIAEIVKELTPHMIIHTAALADVDRCESHPVEAWRQNVTTTKNLCSAAAQYRQNIPVVFISTDQLYDAPGPSSEDQVSSKNVYAETKLAAEDIVRGLEQYLVLRVNFFGQKNKSGKSLLDWVEAQSSQEKPTILFSDVLFNPLHVDHLCEVITLLLEKGARGTFNVGSSCGGMSKSELIRRVCKIKGWPTHTFVDGSVDDVSLKAYRPRDMRMKIEKLEKFLGKTLPTVDNGIDMMTG